MRFHRQVGRTAIGWVRTSLGAACVFLQAACELLGGDRQMPPVVRDSGDVQILEHASLGDLRQHIVLDTEPFLDIGGTYVDPERELDPGAPWSEPVRLSDGRFVVGDMQRLVFFSPDGRFLSTAGNRGDGPGEFQQVGRVCRLPGDTILAVSANDRRVTLWDAHGKHLRTFPRVGPILLDSCFPDGSLVMPAISDALASSAQTPPTRRNDATLDVRSADGDVEYLRIHADGTVVGSLGWLPRSLLDAAVSYYVQVFYAGGRVYVADPRRFEIKSYDTLGTLRQIVRVTEPLPLAQQQSAIPARAGRSPVRVVEPGTARSMNVTRAAFGQVLVDPQRRLWIGGESDWSSWIVLDSDGSIAARLRLTMPSPNMAPYIVSVGNDFLVVKRRDEDGALHLSFFRYRVTDGE